MDNALLDAMNDPKFLKDLEIQVRMQMGEVVPGSDIKIELPDGQRFDLEVTDVGMIQSAGAADPGISKPGFVVDISGAGGEPGQRMAFQFDPDKLVGAQAAEWLNMEYGIESSAAVAFGNRFREGTEMPQMEPSFVDDPVLITTGAATGAQFNAIGMGRAGADFPSVNPEDQPNLGAAFQPKPL